MNTTDSTFRIQQTHKIQNVSFYILLITLNDIWQYHWEIILRGKLKTCVTQQRLVVHITPTARISTFFLYFCLSKLLLQEKNIAGFPSNNSVTNERNSDFLRFVCYVFFFSLPCWFKRNLAQISLLELYLEIKKI